MTLTTQERRDLITYGYQQQEKANRCRKADTIAAYLAEKTRAWRLAGYTA